MSNKPYKQRPNTGTLFINNRKNKDTDPDRKGSIALEIEINGKIEVREFWISGWDNQSKTTGKKYIGLKANPKKPLYNESQKLPDKKEEPFDPNFSDSIPF
jgi:hypothetical protein